MLDFHEPHDFASDETDQREREMVSAMAPPRPDVDHTHAANLVQQFFASSLDANDDDERMTNHGYVVRTSTERINEMESRICEMEAYTKHLESMLRASRMESRVYQMESRIGKIEAILRSWTGGR